MHPALTPVNLTTPITLVSAALWCAATVAAITVPDRKTTAPAPAAASPFPVPDETSALASIEQVSTPKADRLQLFDTRFPATAPPPVPPSPSPTLATPEEPAARSVKPVKQIADSRHARHARAEARDVCERHGMHKVTTRHGRSWRCRR